ncbi:hypothetical protein [Nocardia rhamnosiphila]
MERFTQVLTLAGHERRKEAGDVGVHCGNAHIDVLVNAIAQYGAASTSTGRIDYQPLGQLLWDENVRSVDHRYQETNPRDRYVLHTTEGDLDPLAVLKAIDCYQYQACEHPEWADSNASAWMTQLRDAIYTAVPRYRTLAPSRYSAGPTEPAYRHEAEYDRRRGCSPGSRAHSRSAPEFPKWQRSDRRYLGP